MLGVDTCQHVASRVKRVALCSQVSDADDPVQWDVRELAFTSNLPGEPPFPPDAVEGVRLTIREWREHQWRAHAQMLDRRAAMQATLLPLTISAGEACCQMCKPCGP